MKGVEIQSAGLVIAGEVDVIPHPVDIHGGVDAVILEQGNGNGGDCSRLNVGVGAFQHG